ncbi:MAG: alpha/beta fold hydrolase [Luteitalea sp.]|nr:alpha/beta fold hydrolase [Luteitalea sp.]
MCSARCCWRLRDRARRRRRIARIWSASARPDGRSSVCGKVSRRRAGPMRHGLCGPASTRRGRGPTSRSPHRACCGQGESAIASRRPRPVPRARRSTCFAIDHPDRTLGLVLMGVFTTLRGHATVQELWDSTVSTLTDPVAPAFVRAFQKSTLARDVEPAYFETVVRESLKVPAQVWRQTFKAFLETPDFPGAGAITAPTLILWGDQDGLSPRQDQEALRTAIPGARLIVHRGAGHGLHWEDPGRVAVDLVAFIQELEPSVPRSLDPLIPRSLDPSIP